MLKKKQRSLIYIYRSHLLLTLFIAFIITAITSAGTYLLSRHQQASQLEKDAVELLDSMADPIAAQIVIYKLYKVKLDPVVIKQTDRLGVLHHFAVEALDGECLAGNCDIHKSLPDRKWIILKKRLLVAEEPVGNLSLVYLVPDEFNLKALYPLTILISGFLIFLVLNLLIFNQLIRSYLSRPIENLLQLLDRFDLNDAEGRTNPKMDESHVIEIDSLKLGVKKMFDRIVLLNRGERERYANQEISKFAAKVAHDIRSPLAALKVLVSNTHGLEQDQQLLVKSTFDRIAAIANELLDLHREKKSLIEGSSSKLGVSNKKTTTVSVVKLVISVIQEKQSEWAKKLEGKISLNLIDQSRNADLILDETVLSRIISNVINNSIEAIADKGKIEVLAYSSAESFLIEVRDNGKGIPEQIVDRMFKEPISFGKPKGNGLGLSDVHKIMQEWGGKVEIKSQVGLGTSVFFIFPCVLTETQPNDVSKL